MSDHPPEDEYRLVIVDLFCGGGGFTTGLIRAIVDEYRSTIAAETGLDPADVHREDVRVQVWLEHNIYLVGVNHWDPAVETYRNAHPFATVLNSKVQVTHPPDVVDGRPVDILLAGPSCIPWSQANGGMAKDDQMRHNPRAVAHFLELLRPTQAMLENVPGFKKWGPLYRNDDGELKMQKDGSLFEDWLETLRNLGYSVDYDTFYASDYGDPQSRKRLFVQARLNYEPEFPDPTHGPADDPDTEPHRTAADIIDFDDLGNSIFTRDIDEPYITPPAHSTMQRLAEGVRRHCDESLAPFADALEAMTDDDVVTLREERLVPAEQAHLAAQALDEPFLVALPSTPATASPATPSSGDFIVKLYNNGHSHPITEPLHTVTSQGRNLGFARTQPYLLRQHNGDGAKPPSVDQDPLPTVTTAGAIRVVSPEFRPLIQPRNGRYRGTHSNPLYQPESQPLHTVTAHNHDGHLVTPHTNVLPTPDGLTSQRPRFTTLTNQQLRLSPDLRNELNARRPDPTPQDSETLTNDSRVALCLPDLYPATLDTKYRMLTPDELAQAQGFSPTYEFARDNKKAKTKLIGNAVPVNLAYNLCKTLLKTTSAPTLSSFGPGPEPAADELTSDD
jgi:DNA (cytosine-5)-methyltransferase 1